MRPSSLLLAVVVMLGACSRATGSGGALPPLVVVHPTEPRELLPDQQVQQALGRLTFGARPGDAAAVRAMGVDQWIALQLAPERIDDRATDELLARYAALATPIDVLIEDYRRAQQARRQAQLAARNDGDTLNRGQALREAVTMDPALRDLVQREQRLVPALQSAKLARAVASNRQLQEVMVDFWENHFSVFAGKGQTRLFLASYDRDVIRPHALGRFRDLLGAVAHSPAMLFYLDNWQSTADSLHPTLATAPSRAPARRLGFRRPGGVIAPVVRPAAQRRPRGLNENYARELMELHTLGVDGGYTQADVIEVARALTGWSIDLRTGAFVFRPEQHDAGVKSVLGHTLPAGRGVEDGEEVLDLLARQPATARFVATKLVRHFVSDSAPPALVERAAQTYLRTDGDIREVVRTIVTSPEFFGKAAYRAKVKTPFELVASTLRAMNAEPDTTPRTAQAVARLGQPIFGRQTPDGWPDRGDAWMNTGAILNRINFGLAVAGGRVPGVSLARWTYGDSLRALDREGQVDGVVKALFGGEASTVTRRVLVSGENPLLAAARPDSTRAETRADSATTMADDAGAMEMRPLRQGGAQARRAGANGARYLDRPVALDGLAQVVGLALGAPEFQRR